MDSIAAIIMVFGVVAVFVAIVMFIASLVKKKAKKIPLLILIVGIVMFVGGGLMMPSQPAEEAVTQNSAAQVSKAVVLQYPASNQYFKYNVYNTHVEITEYVGGDNVNSITVPAKLENLPVCVGTSVFDSCKVPTIIFEEGIYRIDSGFSSSLKNVTLPSTIYSVSGLMFKNCYGLEKVIIPEGIGYIHFGAFESCLSLKEITIPSTVKSIDKGVFAYCTRLEKVNLPNGLTKIGEEAFVGCESLKSLTIPETVNEIGFYAFQGTGLVSLEIPASVTTIGESAFLACESLKEVKFYNSNVTVKPYTVYEQGVEMGTYTTGLFGQCHKDLVVYGKAASSIANVCANDKVYFKMF